MNYGKNIHWKCIAYFECGEHSFNGILLLLLLPCDIRNIMYSFIFGFACVIFAFFCLFTLSALIYSHHFMGLLRV